MHYLEFLRSTGDSQKMYSECNEMTFMGHKIKLSPWHPGELFMITAVNYYKSHC